MQFICRAFSITITRVGGSTFVTKRGIANNGRQNPCVFRDNSDKQTGRVNNDRNHEWVNKMLKSKKSVPVVAILYIFVIYLVYGWRRIGCPTRRGTIDCWSVGGVRTRGDNGAWWLVGVLWENAWTWFGILYSVIRLKHVTKRFGPPSLW